MIKISKAHKTNVMRILEQAGIDYASYEWDKAKKQGQEPPSPVYKTLVTVGKSKEYYVFVIPVDHELDLKKAASAVGEKNIHMLKEKDLLPLTGYVHGGCSPIGMKKQFQTTFDASVLDEALILLSAGKVGFSVEVNPQALSNVIELAFIDVKTDD